MLAPHLLWDTGDSEGQFLMFFLLNLLPQYFLFIVNLVIQGSFILYLKQEQEFEMPTTVLVIEVDDMIYQAMAQKRTKQVIESCPPAVTKSSSHTACMDAAVGNWLNVILLCALVIFVNRATCL